MIVKKKILLLWYMVDGNFGDVLLCRTTKDKLEAEGFQIESHEVGDDESKIFAHANHCDFLLFAGGGIIERYIPAIVLNMKKNSEKRMVPYGVIGIGIGNFDYSKYKENISYWVNHAEFFYVRDEETQQILNGLSDSKKVQYSGDCVFANKEINKFQYEKNGGYGINLRNIPYTDLTGDFDWDTLNHFISKVGCNRMIPDSCNMAVKCRVKFNNFDCLEGYQNNTEKDKITLTMQALQQCDWVIAMRFHIVLVAARIGVVPIPIMYCPKVRYISEQLGISELAIELNEWDRIPEKVALANKYRMHYLAKIKHNIIQIDERVAEMYRTILAELRDKLW